MRKVLDWCEYFRQKEEKVKASAQPGAAAPSGKPRSGTRITLRDGKWVRQDA